jgi:hypothetical protein
VHLRWASPDVNAVSSPVCAVLSGATRVRTTLSFAQTVLDDEVRVTVGDAHGCFTARVRASAVTISASETMRVVGSERMDMDGGRVAELSGCRVVSSLQECRDGVICYLLPSRGPRSEKVPPLRGSVGVGVSVPSADALNGLNLSVILPRRGRKKVAGGKRGTSAATG